MTFSILKKNKILKLILSLLAFCLGIHLLVYALQEKFIFLEKKLHADHKFYFDQVFEEHFFQLENGEKINALFFRTQDSLKGTILYFHGNAGNLDRWGQQAVAFTKRGYDVLMIDYRGYGKSDGVPSEINFYEDGQKAYDWLIPKSPPQSLIIYGRSIGSGVACHIAANNPARMLILETPFNNIKNVVEVRFPFLYLPRPFRHQFPNDKNIQQVNYPIHIFHGTKDKVVPYKNALQLKPHLKDDDYFYTIEDGRHSNLSQFDRFNQTLDKVLQ